MAEQFPAKKKKWSTWEKRGIISFAVVLLLTVVIVVLIATAPIPALRKVTQERYMETLAVLPFTAILLLLGLLVLSDSYIRKDQRWVMIQIILVAALLVGQNYFEYLLVRGEPRWLARTLAAIAGYAMRPLILGLFLHLIAPDRNFTWAWILIGINAAIHATALFSQICFWITSTNGYQGGPLRNTCLYISALLLASLLYVTLRSFQPQTRAESWVPVLALILISLGTLLDYNVGTLDQPVSYMTMAMVIGCVAYYSWLHMQFAREHERELIAGQQAQLMLSQIRPHFLYNVLGTIEELCDSDPKAAKKATVQFAQYLRGNMNFIGQEGEIPFAKELEHTRLYLALEKLRFEDALQVEYEIECTDFMIPALTLEPLAENAVRHGIRGNSDGRGTVVVSVRETEKAYQITVADDGPGFDPEAMELTESDHVGIRNVRDRVYRMRGGEVLIQSAPGSGTTATIILPKTET